jgi:hypothetical protein
VELVEPLELLGLELRPPLAEGLLPLERLPPELLPAPAPELRPPPDPELEGGLL